MLKAIAFKIAYGITSLTLYGKINQVSRCEK